MKKALLFLPLFFFTALLSAQCDELFFSEYVEGYANNKGIEIYNPTSSAINLSGYSIVRFSNGSTAAGSDKVIQLPDYELGANKAYVVVVDLTDISLFDSQFDKPVWNGYNVVDTIFDQVTGEVVLDDDGNVLMGPQYNANGSALFGNVYTEKYDMQCKADIFLCPDYDTNNTMYFNGNDAMALISGTAVLDDGSNLIDVIGVIGEDPEDGTWKTADGQWLTKDKTLVRDPNVTTGRNAFADVIAQSGGSFEGEGWIVYPKNSFEFLKVHNSVCESGGNSDTYLCSGPSATTDFNEIPFTMFPNPTSGLVTIEASENIAAIQVTNFMGQRLFMENFDNANPSANIDLSHLATGMYLVDITFAGNKRSVQKLVID